ncbi:MAG TPA: CopG family transcriptional regulator [Mycobacteriales bacterium]
MGDPERAERVNAAAEMLGSGISPSEAARVVAQRFSVSVRQARRYVGAAAAGPVEVPETSVVFTVKLPASLAARVREHAHASGVTISAVVARALTEFLRRARRGRPSR